MASENLVFSLQKTKKIAVALPRPNFQLVETYHDNLKKKQAVEEEVEKRKLHKAWYHSYIRLS